MFDLHGVPTAKRRLFPRLRQHVYRILGEFFKNHPRARPNLRKLCSSILVQENLWER
jgi:hypothetical protein